MYDTDTERAFAKQIDTLKRDAIYERIRALPIRERVIDADYATYQGECARRQREWMQFFCQQNPDKCN